MESKIEISLYSKIVHDCIIHDRVKLIDILLNWCKNCEYNLTTRNGDNMYQLLKTSLHFACQTGRIAIVRYLLTLVKNEIDFDINADPMAKQPRTKDNADEGDEVGLSPLMAIVISNYHDIERLKQNCSNSNKYLNSFDYTIDNILYNIQELECFKLLLSYPDISKSVSQTYNGKSMFLHCVENGKKHLIQHMMDLTFKDNSNENNVKFDFKKESKEKENCLEIAMKTNNLDMLKFLLKNIIAYKMYTNDQISNMCQDLLLRCVDSEYYQDALCYGNLQHSRYYQTFVYLLSDESLIKNKLNGQRFVNVTSQIIEVCFTKRLVDCLQYLLDNYYNDDLVTKEEKEMKKRLQDFIRKNKEIIEICDMMWR